MPWPLSHTHRAVCGGLGQRQRPSARSRGDTGTGRVGGPGAAQGDQLWRVRIAGEEVRRCAFSGAFKLAEARQLAGLAVGRSYF